MLCSPNITLRNARLVSKIAGLVLALVVFCLPARAQSDLDGWIQSQMTTAGVPGLSAAVIHGDRIVWTGQYGLRNADTSAKVLPDTPFLLASVSKLVTATALMQLFDDGAFRLDDPIDPHLPFTVRNPRAPATPITFRQLLAHLGSIDDHWAILEPMVVDGDSPVALGDFLFDYLSPIGGLYDASSNFRNAGPGTRYFYSNVGYALIGYLVERLSGKTFDRFCRDRLFDPLGMDDTRWFLSGYSIPTRLAHPHEASGGGFTPVAHYGFPDYPNGQLRASASDIATFMLAHVGDGAWREQRILQPSTARLMREVVAPSLSADQGLGFYWERAAGLDVVGHNGGEVGTYSDLFFEPESGVGVVVLANGDPATPAALWAVVERLFSEAPSLGGPLFGDDFESSRLDGWASVVGE